jgi:hypothetical protein
MVMVQEQDYLGFTLTISVEHGTSATALPSVDSLPDLIDTFIRTVDTEPLLLVFNMVNVDVSSELLRSDNNSVPKGNILSAWYLFRKRALLKNILVSCILRESRAGNQFNYNAARM